MGLITDAKENTYSGRYIVRGGTHSVTVPPQVRRKLNFHHGDYVIWLIVGDVVRLRKITSDMVLKGEFWEGDKPKETVTKT
jgi:bifunctional DNA-binding transcriptional regulator/antitoxin component of YhaV-PrlF toxin-antitoxin module